MDNYELSVMMRLKDTFTAEFSKAVDNIATKMMATEGVTTKSTSKMASAIDFLKENWIALSIGVNQALGIIGQVGSYADRLVAFGKAGVDVLRVEQAFHAVAIASGYTSEELIKHWTRATKGMVDDTKMMSETMNLLLEGIDASKITDMMDLLTKMAPIAGMSLESAIQRVSSAAVTGRTRAILLMTGHINLVQEMDKYAKSLGMTTERMSEQDQTAARLQIVYEAIQRRSKELGDVQNEVAIQFDQATTKIQNQREELQKLVAPYAALWLTIKVGVLGATTAYGKWMAERMASKVGMGDLSALEKEAAAWNAFVGEPSKMLEKKVIVPKLLTEKEKEEFHRLQVSLLQDDIERINEEDKIQRTANKEKYAGYEKLNNLIEMMEIARFKKVYDVQVRYLEESIKASKEYLDAIVKFDAIEIDQREAVAKVYADETDMMEARHAKELQDYKDKNIEKGKDDAIYIRGYLNLIEVQTLEVQKNNQKQFESRVRTNEEARKAVLEQTQYIRRFEEEKAQIENRDIDAMELRHKTELDDLQEKYKDFTDQDVAYLNASIALAAKQEAEKNKLVRDKTREREDFQAGTRDKIIELYGSEFDAFKAGLDKQKVEWKRMLEEKRINQQDYNDRIDAANIELNRKQLLETDDFFGGMEQARKKDLQNRYTWAKAGFDIWTDSMKNMTQSTSDLFFNVLQGKWDDAAKAFQNFNLAMLRSFSDMLAKMIINTESAEAAMAAIRTVYRGVAAWFGVTGAGVGSTVDYSGTAAGAGPGTIAAEGGIMRGGFTPIRAFRGGGIVRRPTLGLIGEGGEDEAVIPLKGGKVPVQLSGGGDEGAGNVTVIIQAMDAQSFAQFLNKNQNILSPILGQIYKSNSEFRKTLRGQM